MPQRVTQTGAEIAQESTSPGVRVTQSGVELAQESSSPRVVVTQAGVEIASHSSSPTVRITQAGVELAHASTNPGIRVTQCSLAILIWERSSHIWSESLIGGNSVPSSGFVGLAPPPPIPITILAPFSGGRIGGYKPEPGEADELLRKLAKMQESWSRTRGPLQLLRTPSGLKGFGADQEPLTEPEASVRVRKPFLFRRAIPTPYPSDGEVPVIDFEVPEGYWGYLTGYGWRYSGPGFVPGGGDIWWRLRIGNWFPPGLNRALYEIGDPADPMRTGVMLPLRPRQRVQLLVNVPNDSGAIQPGTTRIIAAVCGFYFEKRTMV